VVNFLENLDSWVILGIYLVAAPFGLYAFAHAAGQRAEAFTAAGKLTKPAWLGITGASGAILIVSILGWASGGGLGLSIFWLAALVGVCVYIVDVKPAIVGIQGGGQRW